MNILIFLSMYAGISLILAVIDWETVMTAFASTIGTIVVGFFGLLQYRKGNKTETIKTNIDASDKFRDDIMKELDVVRSRMDSLMSVNAILISEKAIYQVQIGQQQTQLIDIDRRITETIRTRDMFEHRVIDMTQINAEQGKQIELLQSELGGLRARLRGLKGRNLPHE